LAGNALGRDWLLASDSALRTPLEVSLPFHERGFYSRTEARAVAYRLTLAEGQRLDATVEAMGLPVEMFVDLYEEVADSVPRFEHRATARDSSRVAPRSDSAGVGRDPAAGRDSAAGGAEATVVVPGALRVLTFEAERAGTFVLRLQPELLRDGRFEVTLRVAAILAFPVDGIENRGVQSFFGAARDAGRRSHHGIDIFAPRGTPVLAATDGVVRSTSPNRLGGNVVWLSDSRRRQTLYYAHLDRHAVTEGQVVRTGDTLGFVGNSGNARTTAPHLHFGIYRRGQGPIDPWPWVRRITTPLPRLTADPSQLGSRGRTLGANSSVLVAASSRATALRRVPRDTRLWLVGAAGAWYRVQLDDGLSGYLPVATVGGEADTR